MKKYSTMSIKLLFIILYFGTSHSIVIEYADKSTNDIQDIFDDNTLQTRPSQEVFQTNIPCTHSWHGIDTNNIERYNLSVDFDQKGSTWNPTIVPHEHINIVQFENDEYIGVYFENTMDYFKRYNDVFICTYTCTLELVECHKKESFIEKIFNKIKNYFFNYSSKIERNHQIVTDNSIQAIRQLYEAYSYLSTDEKNEFIKFSTDNLSKYINSNSETIIQNLKPAVKNIAKLIKSAARIG